MTTYVLRSDGWYEKSTGVKQPPRAPQPITGFPRINTADSQEPLVSMADGKTYTSKAAMRESYKAANNPQGVNYIEVGHETRAKPQVKPKPDRKAIKDAVERAASEMRTRNELP